MWVPGASDHMVLALAQVVNRRVRGSFSRSLQDTEHGRHDPRIRFSLPRLTEATDGCRVASRPNIHITRTWEDGVGLHGRNLNLPSFACSLRRRQLGMDITMSSCLPAHCPPRLLSCNSFLSWLVSEDWAISKRTRSNFEQAPWTGPR